MVEPVLAAMANHQRLHSSGSLSPHTTHTTHTHNSRHAGQREDTPLHHVRIGKTSRPISFYFSYFLEILFSSYVVSFLLISLCCVLFSRGDLFARAPLIW
jgi:hypothetical protein